MIVLSGAWLRAGGGFSWQFMAPKHQHTEVQKYLANTKGLPAQSSFNRMGRGYPDMSAVAVMGTSESSPTVAGIFSMITDHRLKQGADEFLNSFADPVSWDFLGGRVGRVQFLSVIELLRVQRVLNLLVYVNLC